MDPILAKRERVRRVADAGKRVGYALFGVSIVLFFVALASDLPTAIVTAATATLVGGCVVLAPAILLGYAVKGAERDDRERHGL